MSLLPNSGPPLPQTHEPLSEEVMETLRDAVRAKAGTSPISFALLQEIAAEHNVPVSHVYSGMALDPNLVPELKHEALFAVCTSTCQKQGALENIDKLAEILQVRQNDGKPGFDIVSRNCLDMCSHSPVVLSRSPMGMAAHPQTHPDKLDEIVQAICDS